MKNLTTDGRPGRAFIFVALSALSLSLTSCSSLGQTERGAIIGAASGAVVGGAVGRATGSTARGAIIGAAVGGAAGAIIASRMRDTAETLRQRLPNATVEEVGEGILVTFEGGLLFDFDSSNLRANARTDLASLAAALSDMRNANVLVAGHTDSVGNEDYNYDLSLRRARSAVDYLNSQGHPLEHLQMAGLGESEPIATNETAEGRQQNRRIELAIYASEAMQEEARRGAGVE